MEPPADRRRYPRLAAAVFFSPAAPEFMHHRRATVDVGLGGIRVYSDAELAVGTRLEIDLVRDGHEAARCWVRVAWIETLSPAAGAAYDIGLEFTDITDEGRQALGNILTEG